MTISRCTLATLLFAGGLAAAPPLRADDGTEAAERAQAVLRHYCLTCHGGKGELLKADLQVLDRNLLLQRKLVRPRDAAGSLLLQLVDYGAMPPGELPKPQPGEVRALREWIASGAADFPSNHGDAYVIRQIQNDMLTLDAKKELPYQRYISFNHLLTDDPAADPTLWRDALLKALNHLSLKPEPVPVTAIDPMGAIFRVDERRLGWDVQPFETPEKTANRLDLFDLVLLEYPFATVLPRFDGGQKILAEFMRKANPVRPILYVRGDWFVTMATQSPLYEDLLQLPRTLTGPDGLDAKILAAGKPARAGFLDSKSSRLPQLVERRAASGGAYWRTLDVGTARDMQGLLREAASNAERGGLMWFSLPNGFNGYYLAESVPDVGGKRLVRLAQSAPPDWVADPQAPGQIAHNGLSCMRCHESGVMNFSDAVRSALDEQTATDREKLSPLFPGKEVMDKLLADDAARFQTAVKAAFGGPLEREPLGPVGPQEWPVAYDPVFAAPMREMLEAVLHAALEWARI